MNIKLDIDEFIKDYCEGVKDKDLLIKHSVKPKELVSIIKTLMNQGLLSREDFFERNKRIEEHDARQEKSFIQSLYHCPVCSHVHPSAFDVCPACGTDMAAYSEESSPESVPTGELESESPSEEPTESVRTFSDEPRASSHESHAPIKAVALHERPAVSSIPEDLLRKIGMPLDNLDMIDSQLSDCEYYVTHIVNSGYKAMVFLAEDHNSLGPDIVVKQFRPEITPPGTLDAFLDALFTAQSAMNDPNTLSALGRCELDDVKSLVYPYHPRTLENLIAENPDGAPLEGVEILLPQILNAVGYAHMHRGLDSVVRRLPHGNLKLSKFMLTLDDTSVELEDCGVWSALASVKGHKRYLWEEPGVYMSGLAPESFVHEGKFVNQFHADIYALGALIYKLVTGKDPFVAEDAKGYGFAHLKMFAVPPRVHRWTIPGWLDAMILKCLNKEPAKRWRSATQMELAIGKGLLE